jgi:hypothetical protein
MRRVLAHCWREKTRPTKDEVALMQPMISRMVDYPELKISFGTDFHLLADRKKKKKKRKRQGKFPNLRQRQERPPHSR